MCNLNWLIDETPTEAFSTTQPHQTNTPPRPDVVSDPSNTLSGIPIPQEPLATVPTAVLCAVLVADAIISMVYHWDILQMLLLAIIVFFLHDEWRSHQNRQWEKQTIATIEQYNHVMIVAYRFNLPEPSTITVLYPETGQTRSYELYKRGNYAYIGEELA